jgi:putative resolvase
MDKLVSIKKASELLGVSILTLKLWEDESRLRPVRTKGNHRRYRLSDIESYQGTTKENVENIICVYARVSSNEQKQKGDLDRQKLRLLEYCSEKEYIAKYVFDEVGSGMNDARPKLHKLFELVSTKKISKVVVEHKDRLTRFNFLVYKTFFDSYGVKIEFMEEVLSKSYENELVEDMLSLLASFSAKIYSKRGAENRKKRKDKVSETNS